jgi:acetamidase/formamidase
MTGPFFVIGAEPGDTLALHLDALTPNRATAWSRSTIAPHVLDPGTAQSPAPADLATWELDVAAGTARLLTDAGKLAGVRLPLAPMLGCFGVAPNRHQAISTATSAEHGGNMDYPGFVAGVTVYFPVFEPGALIFVGDGHAVQGDGEILGTGLETSFDIRFTARLLKGQRLGWPRGENASDIFAVGNARPLDQAVQHATTELWRWLQAGYGLTDVEASQLIGQAGRYAIGNVFDPAYTVVLKLSKALLAALP